MKELKVKAKRKDNGEEVIGYYFTMQHDDERTHIHHFIMPEGADISLGTPIENIQVEIVPETLKSLDGENLFEPDIPACLDNEKRLEILEELLNDLDNNCHNSTMNAQIEALSSAIEDLKCAKVPEIKKFSMQNVKNSDEVIYITEYSLKGAFAYWLYYMVPKHPRKFEIIMTEIMNIINECFNEGTSDCKMISMPYKLVYEWIEKVVVNTIPEILELNLTTKEFNEGKTLKDVEDNIVITSEFSNIPEDEDFIDITALIQNVTRTLCKEASEL